VAAGHNGVYLEAVRMKAVWTSACVALVEVYADGVVSLAKNAAGTIFAVSVYDDMLQSATNKHPIAPPPLPRKVIIKNKI
jgi:hypothetical protein